MAKKKSDEPFLMLPRSLIGSYAWRAASRGARQVIDRIALEYMAHGGTQNGKLVVTKKDFIEHGLDNDSIAPAQREACALGLISLAKRGRAGNAEHRAPHQWLLAFIKDGNGMMASTTWKRFHSLQEAKKCAKEARAAKDTTAVAMGKKRAEKTKEKQNVIHFPVPESGTEISPGVRDGVRSRSTGP